MASTNIAAKQSKLQDEYVLKHPTFGAGSLKHVSDSGCLPSTLGYRERVLLAKDPLLSVELGRVYNSTVNTSMPVWERLCTDAAVRQSLPNKQQHRQMQWDGEERQIATSTPDSSSRRCHSGFVINNSSGAEVAKQQQRQKEAEARKPGLDALHSITLRSFKKKYPMDFMAAVRPRAQTTNQTLRMLGVYEEDRFLMARMGMPSPAGVTAETFLPDIKGSSAKLRTTAAARGGK